MKGILLLAENVAEQGITILNLSEIKQFFAVVVSFAFKKSLKNASFLLLFLYLKKSLVAVFNKTGAPTSRIYVAEQGIRIQNLSKTF